MRKAYAAVVALAMPATMYYEGLELKAYWDKYGNVATICYGETQGVKMGDTATAPECKEKLAIKLGYLSYRVDMLVEPEIPKIVHAAAADLAYNVGVGEFKKSNMLKHMRAAKWNDACKAIASKTYDSNGKCRGFGCGWSGGVQLKGLQKRREYWRQQCLAGL